MSPRRAKGFLSVGSKLAGVMVTLVALLASAGYVAVSRHERDSLVRSKTTAAEMLVRLFVAGMSAPLAFGDDRGVQEQVNLLEANEGIVYGAAWATSPESPERLGEQLGTLRRGALLPRLERVPTRLEMHVGDLLVFVAPVVDPRGRPVGGVEVAFSLDQERSAVAAMERRTLAVSSVAAILFSALLLLMARRLIVRPLGKLASAARGLELGQDVAIDVGSSDEIGALANAFRAMSAAITAREREISGRNRDMRRVLDNVADGFLSATATGALSEERSRVLDDWFGPPPAEADLFGYVEHAAGATTAEWLKLNWESLAEGFLPIELILDQFPKRFERDGRFFALEYRAVLTGDGETLESLLVVIREMTAQVERERAEQLQKETLAIFQHVLKGRAAFEAFYADARMLAASITSLRACDDVLLRRQIHTLKGNAGLFGIESVARCCHELESLMLEGGRLTPGDVGPLAASWAAVEQMIRSLSVDREAQITIGEIEHRELLRAIREGAPPEHIAAIVTSWKYEPASRRLAAVGEHVRALAKRMGKPPVQIVIEPTALRLPPGRWAKFWSAFAHVIRNTVDHGLETAEERALTGKPGLGAISMSLREEGQEVRFTFSDDGRGIDWKAIAEKAAAAGLPHETRLDLEEALYSDSISSKHEVSEVSGRGVGMGALREAVRAAGGFTAIVSERGKGTTFSFVFPKTMLCEDPSARASQRPVSQRGFSLIPPSHRSAPPGTRPIRAVDAA